MEVARSVRVDLLLHDLRQLRVQELLGVVQADDDGVVGSREGLVVDADDLERLAPQVDGAAHLGAERLGDVAADDGHAAVFSRGGRGLPPWSSLNDS